MPVADHSHNPQNSPSRSYRGVTLAALGSTTGPAVGAAAAYAWSGAGIPILLTGLLPMVLVLGVVLPAVWSRKPSRRKAALEVLTLLFTGRQAPAALPRQRSSRAPAAAGESKPA